MCKGSRASKKSKTTALNIIKRMMQYPEANTLVVRKVFRTLKDSCFTELKWAINRLGVSAYWEIKESPLEMTYLPTGQKIYFRGLDDPLKVTSITVEIGFLCWCWIEEAYEIMNEADFDMLDESIRGAIPEETGLFKQITLTFNPWNEKHWIRKRFFGEITGKDAQGNPTYKFHDSWISPDGQIYATTTNYLCNEWLDTADLKVFNTMKENNPRRYKVAGLGGWGIVDGLIFDNWREEAFDYLAISKKPDVKSAFGLDFGYTNDPTALFCGLVSEKERTIWVFDELYEKALTNRAICDRITGMGYGKERIKADCAEPKSIDELRDAGLHRIRAARKGKDSVNNGIQYIQGYGNVEEYKSVADAFNEGMSTFDTFQDGWAADAFASGAAWGDGVADKVSGMFDFSALDSMGADSLDAFNLGNDLDSIYGNTGDIANNTAATADALDIAEEDLAYLRDIAEREAINRFTTAEIKVEQHNENHISKDADLDGIMDAWANDFAEKLEVSEEGVHE